MPMFDPSTLMQTGWPFLPEQETPVDPATAALGSVVAPQAMPKPGMVHTPSRGWGPPGWRQRLSMMMAAQASGNPAAYYTLMQQQQAAQMRGAQMHQAHMQRERKAQMDREKFAEQKRHYGVMETPAQVRLAEYYMSAPREVQAVMDKMTAFGGGGPSTVVNVGQMTEGEASKAAQAEAAISAGNQLMKLVTEGGVDPEGLSGLWTQYRTQPTVMGSLSRVFDPISSDEDKAHQLTAQLSQQLIAAMRGASVGPEEEEKFKASLPRFGDSDFTGRLQTTLDNITELENRKRQLRGQPLLQTAPGGAGGGAGGVKILSIRKISD